MKPSVQCMDPSVPPTCSCSCSNGINFNQTLSATLAGGSQPSPDTCQADNEQCLQRENNCKDSLAAQRTLAEQLQTNLVEEERAHTTKLENLKNQREAQEQAHITRETELKNQLETTKQAVEVARNNHTACVKEWNQKPFTYLGCYEDSIQNRVLDDVTVSSDLMTIATCAKICQSFRYYGVEFSSYCFCGNTWKRNPAAKSSNCNWTCKGDANTICGGYGAIGIYQKTI